MPGLPRAGEGGRRSGQRGAAIDFQAQRVPSKRANTSTVHGPDLKSKSGSVRQSDDGVQIADVRRNSSKCLSWRLTVVPGSY